MAMFFVGQRVVCINDRDWPPRSWLPRNVILPAKGAIYTVREIVPTRLEGWDENGLRLREIVNPKRARRPELAFRMSRFRPLRATNIDVFLEMLEPVPAPGTLRPLTVIR
jgi:hypothetical protein